MNLLPYDLTLKEPIHFRRSGQDYQIDSKSGFIIKLEKNNISSSADVSPLPHISTETHEDIHNDCKKIDTNQIFEDIDNYLANQVAKNLFLNEKFLDFNFSKYTKHPSLQHALSCLFSDHYRQLLGVTILGNVLYHGLILEKSKNDYLAQALQLEKMGIKKAKLKIGSYGRTPEAENKILKEILSGTQKIHLRLDANSKFSLNDYQIILKDLAKDRIDYVEEPVNKTSELIDFTSTTKVPLAIDENIQLLKDIKIDGVKAIIIKPTLLGDYHKIKKIIKATKLRDIHPILSSSFESQVGIYQLAQMAYALNPGEHHGLDTFDCYLENLMDLDVQNNAISLKENLELKGPIFI